jgi:hypothetical protein
MILYNYELKGIKNILQIKTFIYHLNKSALSTGLSPFFYYFYYDYGYSLITFTNY